MCLCRVVTADEGRHQHEATYQFNKHYIFSLGLSSVPRNIPNEG